MVAGAARKTFWPLIDQGVVSAGNFLTLIIVARALPTKDQYGTFGLLLECIFYLNTLQSALITYPLTVKGSSTDDAGLRRMTTASLLMTAVTALPAAVIGLGLAAVSDAAALGTAGVFALVAWQVQEVLRRAMIARFRYGAAVWGDGLRYLGTAACLAMMGGNGLTLPKVFFVIGVFSSAAVVVQAIQIRPSRIGRRDLSALVREFWEFGRWLLWGSLVGVLVSVCGVWTIKFFHGNDSVGEFYAIANSTRLINPLTTTLCGLVVQHAARAFADGGFDDARRVAFKLGTITLALTLPYLLALILVPDLAIRLLYGNDSHFLNPEGILAMRVFAVGFLIAVFLGLAGSFLNGIGRTRDSFHAGLVNTVATVLIGFPLTIYYGMLGHVVGGVVTAALQAVALIYLIKNASRAREARIIERC